MLLQSIANPVVGDVQRTQHNMTGKTLSGCGIIPGGAVRVRRAGGAGEACRAVGGRESGTAVGLAEGRTVMPPKQWPVTIDEAIGMVIATLSDEERASIAALARDQLAGLHFGLGLWIRNNLGLWSGNRPLLESTGEPNANDASMVIVEAVWERLREMVPKVH